MSKHTYRKKEVIQNEKKTEMVVFAHKYNGSLCGM